MEGITMHARRLFLVSAVLALAACASSTTLRDSWYDTTYGGGVLKRVVVLGVARDEAERRTFEDIAVSRLKAAGVDAVASYHFLPEGGRVPESRLDEAVRASGADALWMSRVRQIDRRTDVYQTMAPGPMMWGPGWYGVYTGWYPVTEVRQYDVVTVETSIFDTRTKRIVWAGVSETYDPRSVAQEAPAFVDTIAKALRERGLLPPAK
jgi:hypothetical protein